MSGSLIVLALLLVSCTMDPAPSATPDFAGLKMHAIVVGINDYIDNRYLSDLRGPVPDADSMANLLERSGWITHRLIAREVEESRRIATKEAIRQALLSIPADADLVLFYFSGHGTANHAGEAFIIPSDYVNSYGTMISAAELAAWLETMPARYARRQVILDSCNSGGFVYPYEALDAIPDDYTMDNRMTLVDLFLRFGELMQKYSDASGSNAPLVLSAAGSRELAWEQYFPEMNADHGIFTFMLLESAQIDTDGFMHGDADHDGILSMIEAYSYVAYAMDHGLNRWNQGISRDYFPHISGGLMDSVLFINR